MTDTPSRIFRFRRLFDTTWSWESHPFVQFLIGDFTLPEMISCTAHARRRQAQRNISDEDLQFVLMYGRRHRCAGVTHVFLARRDIPGEKATYQRFARLEGTTLLVDSVPDETIVITVYRNRRASRRIRNKAKYDRTRCRGR